MKNIPQKVLFICKGNWFRSQMAAAIYNKLTNTHNADSVGTYVGASDEPEGLIISDAIQSLYFFELMESHGMYIRDNRSRKLLPEMLDKYEVIVSMAEEPFIPDFLKQNTKVIRWNVENPDVLDKVEVDKIYTQVELLVNDLISRF